MIDKQISVRVEIDKILLLNKYNTLWIFGRLFTIRANQRYIGSLTPTSVQGAGITITKRKEVKKVHLIIRP